MDNAVELNDEGKEDAAEAESDGNLSDEADGATGPLTGGARVDTEIILKPSPKEKKKKDSKDRTIKQTNLGKVLTAVVKKYDSLHVILYYAAVVGTEISTFPGIGPATTLKVLHENPIFSSIDAFVEFLFSLKRKELFHY